MLLGIAEIPLHYLWIPLQSGLHLEAVYIAGQKQTLRTMAGMPGAQTLRLLTGNRRVMNYPIGVISEQKSISMVVVESEAPIDTSQSIWDLSSPETRAEVQRNQNGGSDLEKWLKGSYPISIPDPSKAKMEVALTINGEKQFLRLGTQP